MAVVRGGQVAMLVVANSCYVCWYVELESMKGGWSLPSECRASDGLCNTHRARLEEGACLFCGRRLAWLHMASDPELAACRPCLVERLGERVAQAIDAMQDGDGLGLLTLKG